MTPPLGFIVILTLFCNNPDTTVTYTKWLQVEQNAKALTEILGKGKWIESGNRKCRYLKVSYSKEGKK